MTHERMETTIIEAIDLALAMLPDHRVTRELVHEARRQAAFGHPACMRLAREALRRALLALPDIVDGADTKNARSSLQYALHVARPHCTRG